MARRIIFKENGLNNTETPAGFKSLGINSGVFSEKDSNGNTTPLGGGSYEYYIELTINSGQILTLNSNPIEVLPTLTGDKYYDFKIYFEYKFGTTPYTIASSQPPRLINTSDNTLVAFSTIAGISENFAMVVNQVGSIIGLGNINSNIRFLQPGVDPTDGDGTIKLKIYYNIVHFG